MSVKPTFAEWLGKTAATTAAFEHNRTGLPTMSIAQQHASTSQEKEPHPFAELVKDVKPTANFASANVSQHASAQATPGGNRNAIGSLVFPS